MPERPKGHDWKSCVGSPTEGSNPSLSVYQIWDGWVLRNGGLLIPSGPEGSSGRNIVRVMQGCLAVPFYFLLDFNG